MRTISALFLLLTITAGAETRSTMCQATEVVISSDLSERKLVGCGEGFPDNLLWHLDRADSVSGALDGKFTRTLTGRGALIYFIDTGVLATHDEFARATGTTVIGGIGSSTSNGCGPTKPCWTFPLNILLWGHGTGAASVAGGKITGLAPDAVIVAAMNTDGGTAYTRMLLDIIKHAHDPATPQVRTAIISISTGPSKNPNLPSLDALIQRMTTGVDVNGNADPNGKRFLFVAMSGNSYPGEVFDQCAADKGVTLYPSILGKSIDGFVTVGGIDRQNRYWAGSCSGPHVEVLAPAEEVLVASISSNDAYRYGPPAARSGTSWSAPYVAGIAALLLELNPTRTPAELEALLEASVSRVEGMPVPIIPYVPQIETGPRRRSVRH